MLRLVLRWQNPPGPARERCDDCATPCPKTHSSDLPRIRVSRAVQSADKITVSCDVLCWRCWSKHQKGQTDE